MRGWLHSLSIRNPDGTFPLPNMEELRLRLRPENPEVLEHVGRLRSLGVEEDSDSEDYVYEEDWREEPHVLSQLDSWEQAVVELLQIRHVKSLDVPRFSFASRQKVPKHTILVIRDVGQVSIFEHPPKNSP